MPYVLGPRDYCWLVPKNWVIQYRHPSRREVDLLVRSRRLKVEFTCRCGYIWTSMEGYLRIFLWTDQSTVTNVCLMLYQETCKHCDATPTKENAKLNRKEFATQLKSVVLDYENPATKSGSNPTRDVITAKGKPKGPHRAELCEACKKGLH